MNINRETKVTCKPIENEGMIILVRNILVFLGGGGEIC